MAVLAVDGGVIGAQAALKHLRDASVDNPKLLGCGLAVPAVIRLQRKHIDVVGELLVVELRKVKLHLAASSVLSEPAP